MTALVSNSRFEPTTDCIDALRTLPRGVNSSGYRNVYFAGKNNDGEKVWKARIKRGGVLSELHGSRSVDPKAVARCVLAWYRCEYGLNWRAVLAARKVNPFQLRYSEKYQGYIASVWVLGQREEVLELRKRHRNRWAPTKYIAVFPDRKTAMAGMRQYLVHRYGLFAPFILYRAAPAVRVK